LEGIELAHATPATAAQAAVALHHGYGAVESLLVRVSRYVEGSLPTGPDWHVELLESMALELEGVRPLEPVLQDDFDRLDRFLVKLIDVNGGR
jgi:hypothetical protein